MHMHRIDFFLFYHFQIGINDTSDKRKHFKS